MGLEETKNDKVQNNKEEDIFLSNDRFSDNAKHIGEFKLEEIRKQQTQKLKDAVLSSDIRKVKKALKAGADPNVVVVMEGEIKEPLICIAAKNGYLEMVKELVKYRADVNAKNYIDETPLHLAAKKGYLEIVKFLVEHGADVNAKNYIDKTALHYASSSGNLKVVKYLVESKKVDVNAKSKGGGVTPLYLAAKKGYLEVVKFLVEHGEDVNAKDSKQWTPLHLAAEEGHLNIVKYLIEKGADVNAKINYYSWTPLYLAVEKGYLEIVKFLVEHGADVNVKNYIDKTPLHLAAEKGYLEIVKFLVEHGADVNAKDSKQWTPLHLAAEEGHLNIVKYYSLLRFHLQMLLEEGHLNIVKYLIEKGADVNAKNDRGETPLYLAIRGRNLDVVKYLIENTGVMKQLMEEDPYIYAYCASIIGNIDKKKAAELLSLAANNIYIINTDIDKNIFGEIVKNTTSKLPPSLVSKIYAEAFLSNPNFEEEIIVPNLEEFKWMEVVNELGKYVHPTLLKYYSKIITNQLSEKEKEVIFQLYGKTKINKEFSKNDLLKIIRKVRDNFIEENIPKIYINNELAISIISTITRFEKATWKRGHSVKDLISIIHEGLKENSDVYSIPEGYEEKIITIKKNEVKQINFSKEEEGKYKTIISHIHNRIDFESAKKKIMELIGQKIRENENLIKKYSNEKAKENLRKTIENLKKLKKDIEEIKDPVEFVNLNLQTLNIDKWKEMKDTLAKTFWILFDKFNMNKEILKKIDNLSSENLMKTIETYSEIINNYIKNKELQNFWKSVIGFRTLEDLNKKIERKSTANSVQILFKPSRSYLLEFSGYFSDTCWTSEANIGKNFPWLTAVTLILNPKDEVNKSIAGSFLIIEAELANGEKALILRGNNPRENYINIWDVNDYLKAVENYLKEVANKRGIEKILVVVDNAGGAATNRTTIMNAYKERYKKAENKFNELLLKPYKFNGYDMKKRPLYIISGNNVNN